MGYQLSEKDSKVIDYIRAMSIVLVLFIHSNNDTSSAFVGTNITPELVCSIVKYLGSRVFGRVAVPAMFLIASILLYKKGYTWKINVEKKVRTLLIQYIIINCVWILFFLIAQRIPILSSFFMNEQYRISTWGSVQWIDALLGIRGEPLVYPLWFVRDLFFLNLIAKPIKMIIDKFPICIMIILLCGWVTNVNTHIFFCSIQSLFFWCAGYYIVKKNYHSDIYQKIKMKTVIAVYFGLVVLDVCSIGITSYKYIHQVCTLVGLVVFVGIGAYMTRRESWLLQTISRYSFGIFLFHELLLTTTKKIVNAIFGSGWLWGIATYFILPIVIISICILFCILLENNAPNIYSILVGGRNKGGKKL